MRNKYIFLRWAILLEFILAILLFIPSGWLNDQYATYQIEKAQDRFIDLEQEADLALNKVLLGESIRSNAEHISYYLFDHDSLIFWSDNNANIDVYVNKSSTTQRVFLLGEGYYYLKELQNENRRAIAAILVQQKYYHTNSYLQNSFVLNKKLTTTYHFKANESGDVGFKNSEGNVVFSITPASNNFIFESILFVKTTAFFIAILLLLSIVIQWTSKCRFGTAFIASVVLLLLRWVCYYFHFPDFLYQTELFNPKIFALNEWLPNLGDTILHLLFVFTIFWVLVSNQLKKQLSSFRLVLFIGGTYLLGYCITHVFRGLVISSTISFDLSNLFSLNFYSYLGLIIMCFMLCALFLLIANSIRQNTVEFSRTVLFIFLLGIANYLAQYFIGERNIAFINWPMILLLFSATVHRYYSDRYNLTRSLFLILLLSLISSYIILHQTALKERRNMSVMAQKLSEEKDPIAEYLFEKNVEKMQKDSALLQLIQAYWNYPDSVNSYITETYFKGFWQGYELQFTFCSPTDRLLVQPDNLEVNCQRFFTDRIEKDGTTTGSYPLFLMQSETGRISYLSQVEFEIDSFDIVLFAEFNNKRLNENEGYPELLLDQKEISRSISLGALSFAKYENNELIASVGDYSFSSLLDSIHVKVGSVLKVEDGLHNHLYYRLNATTLIELVGQRNDWLNAFTTFSYVFTMLALLIVLIALLLPEFPIQVEWRIRDFTTKIQVFIIGILLLSIGMFSIASTYYIKKQYRVKNDKNISEKLRSVLIEIDQKLGDEDELNQSMNEYMTASLIKFSNVFYTDINLFGADGALIATSRPEIFDIGLKAQLMDAEAYQVMANEKKRIFINSENIGELNYLSAYVPFFNSDGQFLAYLNLPYFAKQDELEEEISSFLVSSINIYVVIFCFSIILSVIFANYISKPLQLLRENISKVNIGTSNEIIEWEGSDEISSLVKEYNRMVVKLADSADLLARTERAGAWKEMAKQVAHEIKNPLTPMKLSIQYLKRASDDNATDLDKRIDRTAQVLIQQIDALAQIADEFSNFAKMPDPQKVVMDFIPVLKNAVNLFDESEKGNIKLQLNCDVANVKADKDQLIRVFNNIIKNALQSIPDGKEAEIKIEVSQNESDYVISFEDNGTGIAKEDYERIFVPNFTSKSSGMGLGLAIVKNSIENSGGTVHFESVINQGTTFILTLPRIGQE